MCHWWCTGNKLTNPCSTEASEAHHQTVHLHNAQDHCPTAQPLFPTAVDVTLASCQLTVELHPLSALERCHWMICKQTKGQMYCSCACKHLKIQHPPMHACVCSCPVRGARRYVHTNIHFIKWSFEPSLWPWTQQSKLLTRTVVMMMYHETMFGHNYMNFGLESVHIV